MKNRHPLAVFFLPYITLGIYSWYWLVKTKGEMNSQGEKIPTAWIWLIPFVGIIWWYWKYSEGVEHVTDEKLSGVLSFVLLFLLGTIGQAIIQDHFNKVTVVAGVPNQDSPVQPVINQNPFRVTSDSSNFDDQPIEQDNFPELVAEAPAEVTSEPMDSSVEESTDNSSDASSDDQSSSDV